MNANERHTTIRKLFRRGIGPQKMPLKNAMIERKASEMLLELSSLKGSPEKIVNEYGPYPPDLDLAE